MVYNLSRRIEENAGLIDTFESQLQRIFPHWYLFFMITSLIYFLVHSPDLCWRQTVFLKSQSGKKKPVTTVEFLILLLPFSQTVHVQCFKQSWVFSNFFFRKVNSTQNQKNAIIFIEKSKSEHRILKEVHRNHCFSKNRKLEDFLPAIQVSATKTLLKTTSPMSTGLRRALHRWWPCTIKLTLTISKQWLKSKPLV